MTGQLAISRLRVPNLDGLVLAAAGNLLSIGAPRHRMDTVFGKSQYTTEIRRKNLKNKFTCRSARSASTCKPYIFESFTFLYLKDNQKKTYSSEWPVRVDSTNPVRASQTTTRHPSARASLDPSGEKATASISLPPRIVNLHARRHCRGLTCSMKA